LPFCLNEASEFPPNAQLLNLSERSDRAMDGNRPGELRLDISDFLCTLSSIKVTRMSLGFDRILSKVAFDLGADIKEIETTKGGSG